MRKLIVLLVVLALGLPAYGDILVYKTTISGKRLETGGMNSGKVRGYLVLELDLDEMKNMYNGEQYEVGDPGFSRAKRILYTGKRKNKWQDTQGADDFSLTFFSRGKKKRILAEAYFDYSLANHVGDLATVAYGAPKATKVGLGFRPVIPRIMKGHCIFTDDWEGSGKEILKLASKKTKNANRYGKTFDQVVAGIENNLENKGYKRSVAPGNYILTVNKTGIGEGTVTGTGINCGTGGTDCTQVFASGTQVTLTASAAGGSTFAGWSGAGSGSGNTRIVFMNQNQAVTATFNTSSQTSYTLTVNKTGNGSGTVTGSGINCGGDCSQSFTSGTQVTLTASPDAGSAFSSWSGADSTNGNTCSVTMNQNKTVTATFGWVIPDLRPSKPINPSPGNGATNQTITADLSWSNGGGATSYNVYFGIDPTPDSGEFKGNRTSTTYDPGTLNYSTTYYWRIDAKNSAGTTTGDVWSFTTQAAQSRSITIVNQQDDLFLNAVVQVKVASTNNFTSADLLADDGLCWTLHGSVISRGQSRTFDITIGDNYYVFIGMGTWEYDLTGLVCSYPYNWWKRTYFNEQGTSNPVWVWRDITVTGHSSGDWVWNIYGSYLTGTMRVVPAGSSAIYFNVTTSNPIP